MSKLMFTIVLLALGACTDGHIDTTPNADPEPPTPSLALTITVTELGENVSAPVNFIYETDKVKTTVSGTAMALNDGVTYTLKVGEMDDMAPDGVTPLYTDDAGVWTSKFLQFEYNSLLSTLEINGPNGQQIESMVTVNDEASYTVPLGLWFDLGAANCHIVLIDDDWEDDYPQEHLAVKDGYRIDIDGIADDESWIEVVGDELRYGGDLENIEIIDAVIDQEEGYIEYLDSGLNATVTCE